MLALFFAMLMIGIVDIPLTFVIQVVFTILLYFLVGLQQSAGQYLYAPPIPFVPPSSLLHTLLVCSSSSSSR